MNSIRLGIIGLGNWGRNLVRVAAGQRGVTLAAVCDREPAALAAAAERCRSAAVFRDLDDMLGSAILDAVIVATPPSEHFAHAKRALDAGLHVLVEKPLCRTAVEARWLVRIARERRRVLMVGHTFLYSNLVHEVKRRIDAGDLGEIRCIHTQRLNLGRVRSDVDALWNFAPHDISIVAHLLGAWPRSVNARGASYIQRDRGIADVAFFQMDFPGDVLVGGHVSWLDPNKVRRVVVVGSEGMLVYDDVDSARPIQMYDKSVEVEFQAAPRDFSDFRAKVRAGDLVIPNISLVEPLAVEIAHFAECASRGLRPTTDGVSGLNVVTVLEAMSRSMSDDGARVDVQYGDVLLEEASAHHMQPSGHAVAAAVSPNPQSEILNPQSA